MRIQTTHYAPVAPGSTQGSGRIFFWAIMVASLCVGGVVYLATGSRLVAGSIMAAPLVLGTFVYPVIGIYAFFALQAWDASFIASGESVFTPAKAFSFLVLGGFVFAALREPVHLHQSKMFVVLVLLYAVWGLVPSAFSPAPFAGVRFAGQHIVQVLLLVATIHLVNTHERLDRLMFWTVVSGLGAALAMFLIGGSARYTRSTLGEATNPVSTALALGTALMCIPVAWAAARRRWVYPIYIAAGVVLTIGIIMTGTRAVLVGAFLGFGFGAAFSKHVSITTKSVLGIGTGLVLAAVFAVALTAQILDRQSQQRLEELVFEVEETGTGNVRWKIWSLGFETYADHLLLGVGLGSTKYAIGEKFGGAGIDIHNTFLAMLIDTGPLGALLFGIALWIVFKRSREIRVGRAGVPAMMMLIYVLFVGLTHTFHSTKWFWIPMTVCMLLAERQHVLAPSLGIRDSRWSGVSSHGRAGMREFSSSM